MVSVCLPSDALLQHLPSYLGCSYLGRGVSLYGCCSKSQLQLLTLDEGYLLTSALLDLQRACRPSCACAATAPWTWRWSSQPLPLASDMGSSSRPPPLTSDLGSSSLLFLSRCSLALSAAAPDLGGEVTPLGRRPLSLTLVL